MAKHVIVGAGLGGLYTANRLINRGVDPANLIIIDTRAGIYTRPGHLSCSTFRLVREKTGINATHSPAHHIKELARAMYSKLEAQGVTFVKETFSDIQAQTVSKVKAVITTDVVGDKSVYPADYVFDCTAKEAYVAQAVNRYLTDKESAPYFTSSKISAVNPISDHLVAHVKIADYTSIGDFFEVDGTAIPTHVSRSSTQKNIHLREQLKALGWKHETFPSFYTYPQYSKNKLCLYMETPEDLPKEQQSAWIKLLLRIYSNNKVSDYQELKPSRKYDKKPRIMGFKSEPHVLNQAIFQADNLPTVMVGFDALKGSDFRLAHGVSSGIECFERMLKYIKIESGSIVSIDAPASELEIFKYIDDRHKPRIRTLLQHRYQAVANGHEYFSDIYKKAALELPDYESDKKEAYQLIATKLAHQGALLRFSSLKARNKDGLNSIKALNDCLSMLFKTRELVPTSNTLVHHDINSKLQVVINELRLEIVDLDIEAILSNRDIGPEQCKSILEQVLSNYKALDGTFSYHPVTSKIKTAIEEIEKSTASSSSVLNPLELFTILALSSTLSSPSSAPPFSFFGPPSAPRDSGRTLIASLLLSSLLEDDDVPTTFLTPNL